MKYIIIGCGIAGITAAETLRSYDSKSEIIMIADEPFYYRAGLSYYLKGEIEEQEIYGKPENWHNEFNIKMQQAFVSGINVENKTVTTNKNDKINFDKLLIATGAKAFVIPWEGIDLDGVCTYRSLNCVKRFMRHIREGAENAVIIGGGILGVELAEDFVAMGLNVTLLVREKRLLEMLFDVKGANIIEKQMKNDGIDIKFETEADSFTGKNGKLTGVKLKTGDLIKADVLGVAIGIKTNIEFLNGSGIKLDRAVLVDEKLQTNITDIYAAGDVCATYNSEMNSYSPTRTWLPCALQGEVAALNMLGYDKTYNEGVFFNASHAYRSMYAVLGKFNADLNNGYEAIECNYFNENYEKIILNDNKIVGAMFIGSMKNVWPVKQAIEARINILAVRDQLCKNFDLQLLLPNEHSILF